MRLEASVYYEHIAEIQGFYAPEAEAGIETPENFLLDCVFVQIFQFFSRKRGKISGCRRPEFADFGGKFFGKGNVVRVIGKRYRKKQG